MTDGKDMLNPVLIIWSTWEEPSSPHPLVSLDILGLREEFSSKVIHLSKAGKPHKPWLHLQCHVSQAQ